MTREQASTGGRLRSAGPTKKSLRALILSPVLSIFLGSTVASAQTDSLTRGSFVLRPARVVKIGSGETIRLSTDAVLAADEITIEGKIITLGHLLHIDARKVVWGPQGEITAFDFVPSLPPERPKEGRGRDGLSFAVNSSASVSRTLRNGGTGTVGLPGNPGIDGYRDPAAIVYVSAASQGHVSINARGQAGGKGGVGGTGGDGGNGAQGRSAYAHCDGWGASCVGYHGPGWSGGEPGNGGPGGQGGVAGMGGNAVPVLVVLGDQAIRNATDRLSAGPGAAGEGGNPGVPGSPGKPGVAGLHDGCSGGPFGIFSCDEDGAPGGIVPSFPDPGNIGRGAPNVAGKDVDPTKTILRAFGDISPPLGPDARLIDTAPVLDKQASVLSAMSTFHVTRTFTYLLTRSLAIAGYEIPTQTAQPAKTIQLSRSVGDADVADVAEIVSDLWGSEYVAPLREAINSGDVESLPDAKEWLQRGRDVQRLLLNSTGSVLNPALAALYRKVQTETAAKANFALTSCQVYAQTLASFQSDIILLSYHLVVPACGELSTLSGAALYLHPLTIHEPLPPIPDQFFKYIINAPLQTALLEDKSRSISGALRIAQLLLNALVAPAHSQAIDVTVGEPTAGTVKLEPRSVGMDPRRLSGRRYLVQSYLQQNDRSYSAKELAIDLRLFSEMVR